MTRRLTAFALLPCFLLGCKSIDGTYYPGCTAFEGNKIRLDDGAVIWEKFTDQVAVDSDGNLINAFPGYPKHGTYRLEGRSLHMNFESDDSAETLYTHQHGGEYLLLTAAEFEMWEKTGRYDDCVLTRERDERN